MLYEYLFKLSSVPNLLFAFFFSLSCSHPSVFGSRLSEASLEAETSFEPI